MSEYKRGYAKGYAAAARKAWPEHRPPRPPCELVNAIIASGQRLRDEVDSFVATIDEDDPVATQLGPLIDAWDERMCELSAWLRKPSES